MTQPLEIELFKSQNRLMPVADGVHTLGAQGNALVIEAGDALVLVDTGPGGAKTEKMIAALRAHTVRPVAAIVYSHGHMGYNFGANQWMDHALERGNPRPQIYAHARVPARYRRYIETAGLQAWLNTRQFRTGAGRETPPELFRMPDEIYLDRLDLRIGGREIALIAAPSETDDVTAVWIPDVAVLYGSAAVIKALPNIGTPLRTLRDPVRWADSLDRLQALGPRIVVPEFGTPATTEGEIHDCLVLPAEVLRWVRREVVARMNAGLDLIEILHDITYPTAWLEHRWLGQAYGNFDYIVRDVWRSENGWWDRNPTQLHPAGRQRAGEAVFASLLDPDHVLRGAAALAAADEPQLGLHVLDLLVDGPAGDPRVQAARAMKAELCEQLAQSQGSYPSRQLYLSAADDLRRRNGAD